MIIYVVTCQFGVLLEEQDPLWGLSEPITFFMAVGKLLNDEEKWPNCYLKRHLFKLTKIVKSLMENLEQIAESGKFHLLLIQNAINQWLLEENLYSKSDLIIKEKKRIYEMTVKIILKSDFKCIFFNRK